MCGILSILWRGAVAGQLVDSLKRLEYREYDSVGVGRNKRRRRYPQDDVSQTSKAKQQAAGFEGQGPVHNRRLRRPRCRST